MPLRVGVVGAGAIGGYFGGMLANAGHDVVLIDGWPAHVAAMQQDGLRIEGMDAADTVVVPVRALDIADVQTLAREPGLDVAIIATKSYDTAWATALIRDYLRPDGYAVSLQNAVNEQTIAAQLGWECTAGGVVMIAGELICARPRAPNHGAAGTPPHVEFRFGEPDGRPSPRLERLAQAVRALRRQRRHGQPLGRALVQAVHQRHPQRHLGRDRIGGQRAGQRPRPAPLRHSAGRRGRGSGDGPGSPFRPNRQSSHRGDGARRRWATGMPSARWKPG